MTLFRVQHIYNHKSGQAEDAILNTLYFSSIVSPPTGTWLTDLDAAVLKFYNDPVGSPARSIHQYIGSVQMLTARETNKIYNMADDPPRIPVGNFTDPAPDWPNNTTPAMPSEVAICLSFRGNLESGQPAARRKGRIFIGPLNTSVLQADTNGTARVHAELQQTFVNAAQRLQADAQTAGFNWIVFSPTSVAAEQPSGGDFGEFEVTSAWVDNAFDTQRRRGVNAGSRVTLAI